MKYLIDTHVLIWLAKDSCELPERVKALIENPENDIYISSVSLWEMAIKINLGKLDLKLPLDKFLLDIKIGGFSVLQIEDNYLSKILQLPYIHKDPFDRLLISTALAEGLTIVTIDENIQKYDVPWVW
ncbi:MAG: type II toxin-antitoxin system VapC family toxin [Defluviitaleaceae bacterium]|nr:type II toxin-antitoxin system VapC family toxin [Defluviitaleaceae bacterium]MCL2262731.1 type II toxin-antitoxin system VapC family toxin [Defluviitaleaceae bacterium]